MDIDLLLLDDGVVFSPSLVLDGESLSIPSTSDSEVFSVVVVPVSFSGEAIVMPYFEDGATFIFLVGTDQEADIPSLDAGEVYTFSIASDAIRFGLIDDSTVFDFSVETGISVSLFEDGYILPPVLAHGNTISFNTLGDTSIVYTFSVDQSAGQIRLPSIGDSLFIYPSIVIGEKMPPLRFKAARTPLGGNITIDNLTALQDYIPIKSSADYSDISNLIYNTISSTMPAYIPAHAAAFAHTYYRGFYIRNDSPSDTRRNIDFWIDGGHTYTISNSLGKKVINEGFKPFKLEEAAYGLDLTEEADELVLGGKDRTSLFGFLDISYLIRDELYEVYEDGIGVGIDLTVERFTKGNTKTRIPELKPGEYVGVYLEITTKFNPDFPVPVDYAFFHLDYSSVNTGFREKYPGQVKKDNSTTGLLLPSIGLSVRTKFDGLGKRLADNLDALYSRYPPYFLHYEEIDE